MGTTITLRAIFGLCIPIYLSVFFAGCRKPSMEHDARIHTLATISEDEVSYSSYLEEDGFGTGRKNVNYEGDIVNWSVTQDDLQYKISFVSLSELVHVEYDDPDDYPYEEIISNEKWIKHNGGGTSRCGPFRVVFEDYYGFDNIKDIGLEPYMDPFAANGDKKIRLCAAFDTEHGAEVPIIKTDVNTYLYLDYNGVADAYTLYCELETSSGMAKTDLFIVESQGSLGIGDDFVLNFKAQDIDNSEVYTFNTSDDVNNFGSFFAVYDDALLEEAQKYINDSLPEFTWHDNDVDPLTKTEISGAVAYTINGQDDPEDFVDKMEQQYQCYEGYVSVKGLSTPSWVTYRNAPSSWEDYGRAITLINDTEEFAFVTDRSLNGIDDFEFNGEKIFEGIRPYAPGYSSWRFQKYGDDFWYFAGESAGTDCVGFVQRSISDAHPEGDNPYQILQENLRIGKHYWTWHDGGGTGGSLQSIQNRRTFYYYGDWNPLTQTTIAYLEKIANRNNQANLGMVIPGDIFYYWGTTLYHIAIVYKVISTTSQRRPELDMILLIESTQGKDSDEVPFGSVIDWRTVQDYQNANRNWRIGRLKQ